MWKTRSLVAPGVLFAFVFLAPPAVRADDEIDQNALERAHNFLKAEKQGRFILGYMHFGSTYVRHKYTETRRVSDGKGGTAPGQFALVYSFDWNDDGTTEVAFKCDRRGNVYGVHVLDSNGIINQPFALANATINVLGKAITEAFKDQLTDEQRKEIEKSIDDADAKTLLEAGMKLQQALAK
jgi:hypothetical protein